MKAIKNWKPTTAFDGTMYKDFCETYANKMDRMTLDFC